MKKLLLLPFLFPSFAWAEYVITDNTVQIAQEKNISQLEADDDTQITYQQQSGENTNENMSDEELLTSYQEKLANIFDYWYDRTESKVQKRSIRFAQKKLNDTILAQCPKSPEEKTMLNPSCAVDKISLVLNHFGNSVAKNSEKFIGIALAAAIIAVSVAGR